ncbi:hypothetical protein MMC30_007959 [Trapelia coarctata]|nr:hypothetical protein [Trapelia coarctata]
MEVSTELDCPDKDEISDAVKSENANNMKLGAGASAFGGTRSVFQASGTAGFRLDISKKQAQEQVHKKMRKQIVRLFSRVRQNYKTTIKTMTETRDISSRRYVLQSAALDPQLKPAREQPCPETLIMVIPDAFPYIPETGGVELEEDLHPDPNHGDWGMHENGLLESDDRIAFKCEYKLPPAPSGHVLSMIKLLHFHGAAVSWQEVLKLDLVTEKFTVFLKYANFANKD